MKKRILYTATSDIHLDTFHRPYLRWWKDQGFEIHLAYEDRGEIAFEEADKVFRLPFPRTPFDKRNWQTLQALRSIIAEGDYALIHCHTPMPGVLTRLAARRARKNGTKVLYTAHGFHFFRGAPLKYWMTYYPVEYWLSRFTDAIITINHEDLEHAQKRMRPGSAFLIPGIGVNDAVYHPLSEDERNKVRASYGYRQGHFLLFYIAEFIHRKNHHFLMKALPELKNRIPAVRLIFAGKGVLMDEIMHLATNLKVEDHVHFLGFRKDLGPIAAAADLGISASRQEGLGLGLAEQMMCGVPVVATDDRGHRELVIPEQTGLLFPQGDTSAFVESVVRLYRNDAERKAMGKAALEHAQNFRIAHSLDVMDGIYRKFIDPQYLQP